MLLTDVLPHLAEELVLGFRLVNRIDLEKQVPSLKLVDRCPCNDKFCASFYTQPNSSWDGKEIERIILDIPGLVCVQTVNGVLARVELVDRPDVRNRICALFLHGR